MNKKSLIFGVSVIALAGLAVVGSAVYAGRGEYGKKYLNFSPEKQEAMQEKKANYEVMKDIIENEDYDAFKELVTQSIEKSGKDVTITEEQMQEKFEKMVERGQLKREGECGLERMKLLKKERFNRMQNPTE